MALEHRARWLVVIVAAALGLCIAAVLVRTAPPRSVDFRAFRCAARAIGTGRDPYRVEPLRSCENASLARAGASAMPAGVVVPAPLPPFALAFWLPFAAAPYAAASRAFASLDVAATVLLAVRLGPLTGLPLAATLPASLMLVWLPGAPLGQPVPIVAVALCEAALRARRRSCGTAPWLALAALEPHLVAPAFAALLARRATRPAAVGAIAALGAISLAVGAAATLEYVGRVAPAHAISEATWLAGQQALPSVLTALGAQANVAVRAGDVAWLAGSFAAVVVARRLARVFDDPAALVLVPVTLALPWSPYLHATQLGLAVPGALWLAGRAPGTRAAIVTALAMLAVPWNDAGAGDAARALLPPPPFATELASVAWRGSAAAFAAADGRSTALLLALKFPVLLAFGLVGASAAGCAFAEPGGRLARRLASTPRSEPACGAPS